MKRFQLENEKYGEGYSTHTGKKRKTKKINKSQTESTRYVVDFPIFRECDGNF